MSWYEPGERRSSPGSYLGAKRGEENVLDVLWPIRDIASLVIGLATLIFAIQATKAP